MGDARRDDVAWVDMAMVTDGSLVSGIAAEALGMPVGPGSDPSSVIAAGLLRDKEYIMTLRTWQVAILMGATLTMGLMAGVFGLYAHTIMRGLGSTDDRTFVGAFQAIDRAIINPLFMPTFVGALVLTGVAGVLYLGDDRSVLPWVAVAFGLYLIAVVITIAVHVPLNDAIKAAGDPDRIVDLTAVRHAFNETRWVACGTRSGRSSRRWHSSASHGRSSSTGEPPSTLTTAVALRPPPRRHPIGSRRDRSDRCRRHGASASVGSDGSCLRLVANI